jgi:hypothetical protein
MPIGTIAVRGLHCKRTRAQRISIDKSPALA